MYLYTSNHIVKNKTSRTILCRKYVCYICLIMFILAIPVNLTFGNDIYNKTKIKPAIEIKAYPFELSQVKLLDSPFKKAMELNQEYLLKLDPDRALWPYHKHAGMPTKGERYGGWEQKDLVGQTTGHYLSACSMMYASTGNRELKRRVDYMVSEMAKTQHKNGNGYVGPVRPEVWDNTFGGKMESGAWSLGGGYVPWYVLHKTYAGLIDAYVHTGNKQALDVVCAFADWAKKKIDTLDDDQIQQMLVAEHGGMNESLTNLYAITGNKDYLKLARRFDHKEIIDPLAEQRDELVGKHVNTQLPKIIGSARLYEMTGEERYATISSFLWDQVVNKRAFVSGGVDLREHFLAPGVEEAGLKWNSSETCAVYNMLKLTRHLFGWKTEARYMDYYERGLYNQILGSQDPDSGGFTYFYSLQPGHFKIYSTPFDSMWCCVGTGIENHSKYGDTIYFHNDQTLWVNLFIPSILDWQEQGVSIRQETKFPVGDTTTITISAKQKKKLAILIRVPYWATEGAEVKINGKKQNIEAKPQSYLSLSRTWQDGDKIEVRLPMSLRLYHARDNKNLAAIMYGPLALAGELGTEGMPKDDVSSNQSAYSNDMAPPVPTMVVDSEDVSSWVKRVEGEDLRFRTVNAGNPRDVTLIPVANIHHQRYTVYWEMMSSKDRKPVLTLDPAIGLAASNLVQGITYKYYQGAWDLLPDFDKLTPVKTGTADNFDLSFKNQNDEFGFVFSGYIKIDEAGEYHFATKSDDGSRLLIDGKRIVENDGIHAMIGKNSSAVPLEPGYYPIELSFFERGGGEGLEVLIHTGQGSWKRVPKEMLYRDK